MPSTIDPKRLLTESLPVAGILLFWNLFAVAVSAGSGITVLGLRTAGVVMALLYVAGRIAHLVDALPTTPTPVTPEAHLRENGRVLLAAGAWFLAALVVSIAISPTSVRVFRLFERLLTFPLAGAGVAVVLLYAAPAALGRWRDEDGDGATPEHVPDDDDRPAASD